jgi:pyruvate,water dikinase
MEKQRESFNNTLKRFDERFPGIARRIRPKLVESALRARLRELARSAYIRDRWAIRLFAIRAGELTGLGEKIFYLTLDELLVLLTGDQSVTSSIGIRLEAYKRLKTLPPYPSVIQGRFDPFTWAQDPNRPTDIYLANKSITKVPDSNLILGSPGSTGVVEGFVRIIDHPENSDQLQNGEIMVAVQTDIAWTLLFPNAAAVITDIGAPLSHAAIVARELGIPAVVGCGNATAVLRTGDRVRVDGANGTVEIIDRGSGSCDYSYASSRHPERM